MFIQDEEPLVVSPKRCCALLDLSHSRVYELIAEGELDSFKDGKLRKILYSSVKGYVARKRGEAA